MTIAAIQEQIKASLLEFDRDKGVKETLMVPLSRGDLPVPVIGVKLDLPLLNPSSSRIAPDLIDTPSAEIVRSAPYSVRSQKIISALVKAAHRHTEELKASLKASQNEPGVITRKGVLINANTRCVLMRELYSEGELRNDLIRVAVLPADVNDAELLDLEAVLQRRRDHKDEYSLVGELLMLQRLHIEAKLSEEQIRKRQDLNKVSDVRDRFKVLALMDRARHLCTPVQPLRVFVREKDNLQNWKELMGRVDEIGSKSGFEAADNHIREWLISYFSGSDSVHVLRNATEGWVEKHLKNALEWGGGVSEAILKSADAIAQKEHSTVEREVPTGLDLLHDPYEEQAVPSSNMPNALLDIAVQIMGAEPDEQVTLSNGQSFSAAELKQSLENGVKRGLAASKATKKAGNRYEAPERLMKSARESLNAAMTSLDDVASEPEFANRLEGCGLMLEEIDSLLKEVGQIILEAEATEE